MKNKLTDLNEYLFETLDKLTKLKNCSILKRTMTRFAIWQSWKNSKKMVMTFANIAIKIVLHVVNAHLTKGGNMEKPILFERVEKPCG